MPLPPVGGVAIEVVALRLRWLLLALLPHVRAGCAIAPDANGHVDYPSGETSVPDNAFGSCGSLVSITLPSSLTSIGVNAFNHFGSGCNSLASITLPAGLTSIGQGAFRGCSLLTSVALPSGLTSIGSDAFRDCYLLTLTSVALPPSLTSIGSMAFWGTSITSIALPSSLTNIGYYAFRECSSLTSITSTLPSSLTSIGSGAFMGCSSLTAVALPSILVGTSDYMSSGCYSGCGVGTPTRIFEGCSSLISLDLSSLLHITRIDEAFCYGCTSLSSVTLPSSLTSIGESAFRNSGLTSIALPPALSSIGDFAFNGCSNLGLVHVPAGCSVGTLAFYSTAAPPPGYVLGLPPAPPQPPPSLPSAPPSLPPSPLSCGSGTSVNAATNQCEIPCDDSGRRMADEIADELSDEPLTARDAVSTYLKSHPHLDEATVQHFFRLVSLGRNQCEQHFWEPVFA